MTVAAIISSVTSKKITARNLISTNNHRTH